MAIQGVNASSVVVVKVTEIGRQTESTLMSVRSVCHWAIGKNVLYVMYYLIVDIDFLCKSFLSQEAELQRIQQNYQREIELLKRQAKV